MTWDFFFRAFIAIRSKTFTRDLSPFGLIRWLICCQIYCLGKFPHRGLYSTQPNWQGRLKRLQKRFRDKRMQRSLIQTVTAILSDHHHHQHINFTSPFLRFPFPSPLTSVPRSGGCSTSIPHSECPLCKLMAESLTQKLQLDFRLTYDVHCPLRQERERKTRPTGAGAGYKENLRFNWSDLSEPVKLGNNGTYRLWKET